LFDTRWMAPGNRVLAELTKLLLGLCHKPRVHRVNLLSAQNKQKHKQLKRPYWGCIMGGNQHCLTASAMALRQPPGLHADTTIPCQACLASFNCAATTSRGLHAVRSSKEERADLRCMHCNAYSCPAQVSSNAAR
jgi:hypothetical protein